MGKTNFWQQMAEFDTVLHMYDDVFSDGKPKLKPTRYGGNEFDDLVDVRPGIAGGNVGTIKPTEFDDIFK